MPLQFPQSIASENAKKKFLKKLLATIAFKHGIAKDIKINVSASHGIYLTTPAIKPFCSVYAFAREFGTKINNIFKDNRYFNSYDALIVALLDPNVRLYVYNVDRYEMVNVTEEFGKTIEEVAINCDLLK